MDFSIILDDHSNINDVRKAIEKAYEFGYECVALNTVIDKSHLSGKKISVPEPKTIEYKVKGSRNFRVLSRLTAIIEDGLHGHNLMKSPNSKKYDILAIQPVGEKMLNHVRTNLDCDIVCLDMTDMFGFSLKKTHVNLLISKGISFEISYAPCLRSQAVRRRVISNSQLLVDVMKSKNIIISSGAMRFLDLRSVEDVSNLALLFGFSKEKAHAAVTKNGQLVLSHALTRNKTGCGFVSMTGIIRLPKYQGWVVKACKIPKASSVSNLSTKRKLSDDDDNQEENSAKRFNLNG